MAVRLPVRWSACYITSDPPAEQQAADESAWTLRLVILRPPGRMQDLEALASGSSIERNTPEQLAGTEIINEWELWRIGKGDKHE